MNNLFYLLSNDRYSFENKKYFDTGMSLTYLMSENKRTNSELNNRCQFLLEIISKTFHLEV